MRMFEVGGCVRDELLGVSSKDIDFSVVLEESDLRTRRPARMDEDYTPVPPFEIMVDNLTHRDFYIYRDKKDKVISSEHLTARGRFPENHPVYPNVSADFVLARKEGVYTDGRRPDSVEPGTLMDDLRRRDFTMNAIAKDEDGSLIDPFNGVADIEAGIIRAVGDPMERLTEDALRALRALRFAVTKGFMIEEELSDALSSPGVARMIVDNISDERIEIELSKMLAHDTRYTLALLSVYPLLTDAALSGSVRFTATMKAGRK